MTNGGTESVAKGMGLIINEGKTKFMTVTSRTDNSFSLQVKSYTFERVHQFT